MHYFCNSPVSLILLKLKGTGRKTIRDNRDKVIRLKLHANSKVSGIVSESEVGKWAG